MASLLIRRDNVYDSKRAAHYFEQLIPLAGELAWGERALFEYAQWLGNGGPLEYDEQGNPVRRPDPAQALQLYRRLLEGSSAGESAFYKQAQRRIELITSSMLEVRLSNAFLPGSEVQFQLSWRNLSSLNLDLFAIDLTRGISPARNLGRHRDWNEWPDLEGRRPLFSWTHPLPELPRYQLGQQAVTLPHRLDPGAYVLRGRSGDTQGGAVESTVLHVQALIEIEPSHPLVEPAIQWLVQNRRGNQWSNTRDTALSVLALNEYLKATGELESGAGFEVLVNGQRVASGSLRGLEEALARPVQIQVEPGLLRDGLNRIQIRRTSAQGSLYFAAEARFFSLEEPIPSGGNQVFVQRDYYRLVPVQTLLKGTVFERQRLQPGEALQSGERVEVILTLEAKNDLTYLMLEDLKPAGLESVEVQSGAGPPACRLSRDAVQERQASGKVEPPCEDFGIRRHVYRELRDRKVALFIDRLDQGWWEIRYQMRAEVPGRFHALPVVAQAMYAPEIRANSREQSLEVLDR